MVTRFKNKRKCIEFDVYTALPLKKNCSKVSELEYVSPTNSNATARQFALVSTAVPDFLANLLPNETVPASLNLLQNNK